MSMTSYKKAIPLMILCSICLALGQFIWKVMPGGWAGLLYLIGGFIVYGLGAVSMLLAYRYGELSVLQPMNSLSYVIALILGFSILNEPVTLLDILGVAAIIAGVILIGGGDKK